MQPQSPNQGQNAPSPQLPRKPEQDDYESASKAMREPYDEYGTSAGRVATRTAPSHRVRKALLVFVVLVLIGGAVFYVAVLRKDTKPADSGNKPAANQTIDPVDDDPKISTKTEHYLSSVFGVEFDHPHDWTASEPSGGGMVVVQSPTMQLKDSGGAAVSGQTVFTIRDKQQPLPEFDKGNAIAARESEKIDYKSPSSVQRGSTYVSFLNYAGGSGAATDIDGLYITGNTGYQLKQAIPKADFVPVDPVISITFQKCANETCGTDSESLTVAAAMWDEAAFTEPLMNMLKSVIIN